MFVSLDGDDSSPPLPMVWELSSLPPSPALEDPAPEDPAPEDPAPEDPAPEDPAPEDLAQGDPAGEEPADGDGKSNTSTVPLGYHLDEFRCDHVIAGGREGGRLEITRLIVHAFARHAPNSAPRYLESRKDAGQRLRVKVACRVQTCDYHVNFTFMKRKEAWVVRSSNQVHTCTHGERAAILRPGVRRTVLNRNALVGTVYNGALVSAGKNARAIADDHGTASGGQVELSEHQARRLRRDARTQTGYPASIARLRPYFHRLVEVDTDAETEVLTTPDGAQYVGACMMPGPMVRLLRSGKLPRVYQLDATHFKEVHKTGGGVAYVLTCTNGDHGSIMLATAHSFGNEDKDGWKMFLAFLRRVAAAAFTAPASVLSDRNKGLVPAMAEILRDVDHYMCVEHLLKNLVGCRAYSAKLRTVVQQAALALTEYDHLAAMEKLPEPVREYLTEADTGKWALCYRKATTLGRIASTDVESVNNTLRGARLKPPVEFFAHVVNKSHGDIRRALTVLEQQEKRAGDGAGGDDEAWATMCGPKTAAALISELQAGEEACRPGQVFEEDMNGYVCEFFPGGRASKERAVELAPDVPFTCECRFTVVHGLPCRHMWCLARRLGMDRTSLCERACLPGLRTSHLLAGLRAALPLRVPPTTGDLAGDGLAPPARNHVARVGRPRSERPQARPATGRRTIKCGECGQPGHNRVTCQRKGKKRAREEALAEHRSASVAAKMSAAAVADHISAAAVAAAAAKRAQAAERAARAVEQAVGPPDTLAAKLALCRARWEARENRWENPGDRISGMRVILPAPVDHVGATLDPPVRSMAQMYVMDEDIESLLATGAYLVMNIAICFQRLVWMRPEWIALNPFSPTGAAAEAQMCQHAASDQMTRDRWTTAEWAADPLPEAALPAMPRGSCLIMHMQFHFAVLAMDYEADPPQPVLLDTLSRLPFLDAGRRSAWARRLNMQARRMFGDAVPDVKLDFHVQQQPCMNDDQDVSNQCGLYACALLYDIMVGGKTVQEVKDVVYDKWSLRPWLFEVIFNARLVEPPRLSDPSPPAVRRSSRTKRPRRQHQP